ncbi:hypothetical protein C8R45DRAFT_1133468 [Mycena sanguinolenta]|nr:hypothetical protein C8R45DRAFT_1133468 [Mycena sanguinolenta]
MGARPFFLIHLPGVSRKALLRPVLLSPSFDTGLCNVVSRANQLFKVRRDEGSPITLAPTPDPHRGNATPPTSTVLIKCWLLPAIAQPNCAFSLSTVPTPPTPFLPSNFDADRTASSTSADTSIASASTDAFSSTLPDSSSAGAPTATSASSTPVQSIVPHAASASGATTRNQVRAEAIAASVATATLIIALLIFFVWFTRWRHPIREHTVPEQFPLDSPKNIVREPRTTKHLYAPVDRANLVHESVSDVVQDLEEHMASLADADESGRDEGTITLRMRRVEAQLASVVVQELPEASPPGYSREIRGNFNRVA